MDERSIAIPAASRAGLGAAPAPDMEVGPYLLIAYHDGTEILNSTIASVPPPEWLADGFAAGLLARHKVVDVIVGEMDPYLFVQLGAYGLRLWAQGDHATVAESIDALVAGELEPFVMEVPDELLMTDEAEPAEDA